MRKAIITYHLVNLLHLFFYAFILLSLLNYFELRSFMMRNVYYIIAAYGILYFALNYSARQYGKGLTNPIISNRAANLLHAGSVVIFALAFYLYFQKGEEFVYLMLLSFPMDIFAVVLAYRSRPIPSGRSQNLDSLDH